MFPSSALRSNRLVLLSSIRSPLLARVTGSWSNRALLIEADWINPSLPTKVAVDARVNVGVGPFLAVNVLSVAKAKSRDSPSGFIAILFPSIFPSERFISSAFAY